VLVVHGPVPASPCGAPENIPMVQADLPDLALQLQRQIRYGLLAPSSPPPLPCTRGLLLSSDSELNAVALQSLYSRRLTFFIVNLISGTAAQWRQMFAGIYSLRVLMLL
jgi:hypothetical protein